jgi:hypothetical protein
MSTIFVLAMELVVSLGGLPEYGNISTVFSHRSQLGRTVSLLKKKKKVPTEPNIM